MKTYLRDLDIAIIYEEKGIEKGIKQGKDKVRLEFICNMLSDFSDEQISKVSKLSIERISQIREEYLYNIN